MRLFFLLLMLAGAAAGFGYPWYIENLSGADKQIHRVYERGGAFKPVDIVLSQSDAPVRVFVDMVPLQGFMPDPSRTMLTLTASTKGRTVLASSLSYMAATQSDRSPQSSDMIYRDRAGDIEKIEPGQYRFVVGEGDREDLSIKTVDIVLHTRVSEPDARAIPVGVALFALGFFGLVRSRRNAKQAAAAEAAKPQWGRDANQS